VTRLHQYQASKLARADAWVHVLDEFSGVLGSNLSFDINLTFLIGSSYEKEGANAPGIVSRREQQVVLVEG
jgi:hypothetical protein